MSPSFASNFQLSLSFGLRLNCRTMLIGTVVLRDVLFVLAGVRVVISPLISSIFTPLFR